MRKGASQWTRTHAITCRDFVAEPTNCLKAFVHCMIREKYKRGPKHFHCAEGKKLQCQTNTCFHHQYRREDVHNGLCIVCDKK